MKIEDFLKQRYKFDSTVTDNWKKYVALWKSWYVGKVKSFHNYSIYNGIRSVRKQRLSLQMPKKSCEDWADFLFNERCKISLADENSQKELLSVLNANDFWVLTNNAIEFSGASGTGAFVVSVDDILIDEDSGVFNTDEAHTKIRYVDVESIYPISWEGRKITECAFAAKHFKNGKCYVNLSVHLIENNEYVIHNHLFEDIKGSIKEVEDADVLGEFKTGSMIKWFSMLSPCAANNIYPNSPWGVPYFANALDISRSIDMGYDSLDNEINLGRKRIFARTEMFNVTPDGTTAVFDANDISIYQLPKNATANDLIQAENSNLRVSELKEDIEFNLSLFGDRVGFGPDHYIFSGHTVKTATEVISTNSKLFRRKKKHESVLENALIDVLNAVAYASSKFGSCNINTEGLKIQFDDSIIEDKEAIANRALREVNAGVRSEEEYRVEVYGEDEETAKKKIAEIKKNSPKLSDLVGDG